MVGLGAEGQLQVYCGNRPPMPPYEELADLMPLQAGEIAAIAQHTGNHWRKIFNVYSKLVFEWLHGQGGLPDGIESWQNYRDRILLQAHSGEALLFDAPVLDTNPTDIHLIMGKQYAAQLGFHENQQPGMYRLDADFAIWPAKRLIVCPYFDYRQLSNIKISQLVALMSSLTAVNP